ncbi:MAG: (Fe-S)-binding protein [Candidatus Nezhaarchaeales archaeon]
MRTIIGIVGSNRKARLRLMKELSSRLESEGYSVILVFHHRHDNEIDVPSTLTVSTLDSSTFIKANFKLTVDDLKRLLPNKWCLILVEGYKVAPYIVAATSKYDVDEYGPQSLAITPLSNDLMKFTAPLKDKIVEMERLTKVVREALIRDITKFLMQEDCGECGFKSCRDLAEAIAKGEYTPLKCIKRRENVRLMVDGNIVQLNPFTSKIFIQVVSSLLSILKGVPRSFKKVIVEINLD